LRFGDPVVSTLRPSFVRHAFNKAQSNLFILYIYIHGRVDEYDNLICYNIIYLMVCVCVCVFYGSQKRINTSIFLFLFRTNKKNYYSSTLFHSILLRCLYVILEFRPRGLLRKSEGTVISRSVD